MADIILAGSTSGSITVSSPAISGTNTLTLPVATDTLVGLAATQTLTNKTLTSPVLTTPNLGTPSTLVLTNATGLAAAAMPAGSVVQVVSTALTTTFTTTSTTYVAVTGLSAVVTPASVSNKLLITGFISLNATSSDCTGAVAIDINGSKVGSATSVSLRTAAHTGLGYTNTGSIYRIHSVPFSFLHSPASTSAQTVAIHICNPDTSALTLYVNRSSDDTDAVWITRQISNITVMEIKG